LEWRQASHVAREQGVEVEVDEGFRDEHAVDELLEGNAHDLIECRGELVGS
jgi:hypothetical protein